MRGFVLFLCALFVIGALFLVGIETVMAIKFDRGCEGYLKRAADSNTVELAQKNLNVAVEYAESHNLTKGYTSVLWTTPDEDIEFWYSNLKASQEELSKVTADTTALERSNMLMKLRETLLDQKEKGTAVTIPDGISRYPYNGLLGVLCWIFFPLGLLGAIIIFVVFTDHFELT